MGSRAVKARILKTLGLGLLTAHYLLIIEFVLLLITLMADFALEGFLIGWSSPIKDVSVFEIVFGDLSTLVLARIYFGFTFLGAIVWGVLSLAGPSMPVISISVINLVLFGMTTTLVDLQIGQQFFTFGLPLYRLAFLPCAAFLALLSPFILARLPIPNSISRISQS